MDQDKLTVIDQAIRLKSKLLISFDYAGGTRSNVVIPIRWMRSGELCAFSIETNGEIFINPGTIHRCEVFKESHSSRTQKQAAPPPPIKSPTYPPVERKPDMTDAPTFSPRLNRNKKATELEASRAPAIIDDVKNSEDWRRLMLFYRDCLIHEGRQEFVIDRTKYDVFFFDIPQDQLDSFIEGKIFFTYEEEKQRAVYKFVQPPQKRNDLQLFIGYPIYVSAENKLAPILIAPVAIEDGQRGKLTLHTEEYEVSYAALASLNLKDEEISSVLESLPSFSTNQGQSLIQSLIQQIIQKTSELLGDDLTRLTSKDNSLMPGTVVYRPCFFWAKPGIMTANLLKELESLSRLWESTPHTLKNLLSTLPEYEYPKAPAHAQDQNIYVAPVYDNQRQAISAAMSQPVAIVTGPPGTGKSQFILNLIVQAVLKGEKVLFASRNNKAVDVVMTRLLTEMKFPGAIRTGNKEQRAYAIDHIEARLKELAAPDSRPEDITALQERYRQYHQKYLDTLGALKKIRSQGSLLTSRLSEVEDIKKLLPPGILERAAKYTFSFSDDEFAYAQAQLANLRLEALQLKSQQDALAEELKSAIGEDANDIPLVMVLKNYEDQWGAFGDELLHPGELNSAQSIQSLLDVWQAFLEAAQRQSILNSSLSDYRAQKTQLEQKEAEFAEEEPQHVRSIVERIPVESVDALKKQAEKQVASAERLRTKSKRFWFRLMVRIGLNRSVHEAADNLRVFQEKLQIQPTLSQIPSLKDVEQIFAESVFLSKVVEISRINSQVEKTKKEINHAREDLEVTTKKLPPLIAANLKKVTIPSLSLVEATKQGFQKFIEQSAELGESALSLKQKIQGKLDDNADEIEFLRSVIKADAERKFALWAHSVAAEPQVLVDLLSNWRMTLSFWKAQNVIEALESELKKYPSEEKLSADARETGSVLFGLGGKIVTLQWKKYARSHESAVFQQAELYVSTVRQLLQKDFTPMYGQLKAQEEQTFPSVMKLFPVWATTNLSAKSNFPLKPYTFDLVIIDEASQSDLPSALPLLYRGGRVVVVGDEMQLRHVASIFPASENETSLKHGISLAKYSYSRLSLFDITRRAVQPKPATILLNEHYRSDPQIFGFSKEEFYSEDLKIYTDMFRFSLPSDYIKDGTGVFWVDVPGTAQHPHGGSAYNDSELRAVSELTLKLLHDFKRRKMNTLNFGIISPYHEQEKRLLAWLETLKRSEVDIQDRIIAGTAHKFQGDERDVVIFSPVLSDGIKDRSKNWLEETSNLLNVAVSRARITMIVVGDWKYCLALDPRSKYRKLAEYVGRYPGRVVNSMGDLPIFKGMHVDIIGVLLDRHNRERNRLTMQKLLLASDQFVYWADPFITNSVFDLFFDISKHPEFRLKDIRILTALEQTKNTYNPLKPDAIRNIQAEFHKKGITIQLGLLPKHQLPHDRHFYSVGYSINMPPFSGAYGDHKMVSEYTESKTKTDFFESYWVKAKKY